MYGLTNSYVNEFLTSQLKTFKGVYPSDKTGNLTLKDGDSIVINLDPSNEKGSHFIAVLFENNFFWIFDSINITDVQTIPFFFAISYNDIKINNYAIQNIFSDFCGYYCICFILSMKYINYESFLDLFIRDYKINDYICIELIKIIVC